MKKKIITALVAVALGHTAVLWGLAHMKTPELKPIEKEPLKVRFVKIQEPPKPEPPKPKVEPKKETPPPPPKEVKIVDAPPPPPKKVEKVEQVKKAETPKPVAKPVETKPQPVAKPAPVIETKVVTKAEPVVVAPATPPAPPAPPAPPTPPAPPAPPSPKSVSIGGSGVQWSRSPKPQYSNKDLQGETRRVVVHIEADAKGNIKVARVTQSSGVPALDEKIRRAVMSAKFKPYKENGIAYPISASQPFELTLNPNG
jgi:protein TonB